jgi:hypothetical protein
MFWYPDFSTAGAAAYQTGQTGYAVTPTAATAATYTAQRAGTGYETAYQTAATHTTAGTYAGNMLYFVYVGGMQQICSWLQFFSLELISSISVFVIHYVSMYR